MNRRRRARAGFTLIELVVSLSIMSILLLAMGSAVLLAGKAMPEPRDPTRGALDGWSLAERLTSELTYAVHFSERTSLGVTFTVADRDGDGAPEEIRYTWSGAAGEPLLRRQNGGPEVAVAPSMAAFAIEYELQKRSRSPRVLLVVPDASTMGADDQARIALLRSWGCAVATISADAAANAFVSAAAGADVAYVSEEVSSIVVGTKLYQLVIGVALEEGALWDEMGLSTSAGTYSDDHIDVVSNTHEIVSFLDLGKRKVVSGKGPLNRTAGLLAPGLLTLARQHSASPSSLGVIEPGGILHDGRAAAGRRVLLPWGGSGFDFTRIEPDGRELLERAIEWAAGPSVLTAVHLTIQTAPDARSRVETSVRVCNEPGVPGL